MTLFYINRIFKSYDNQSNVLAIEKECHFQKGSVISLLGLSGSGILALAVALIYILVSGG